MACNCSTQEEINRLYKAYGDKAALPEKPKLSDYVKYYGGNILAYTLLLVSLPFLILYVLFLLFWREDERIHANDVNLLRLFNTGKTKDNNVRKQQII